MFYAKQNSNRNLLQNLNNVYVFNSEIKEDMSNILDGLNIVEGYDKDYEIQRKSVTVKITKKSKKSRKVRNQKRNDFFAIFFGIL